MRSGDKLNCITQFSFSYIHSTFLLSAISLVLMLMTGNFWYILILIVLFFTFTSIMRPAINTLLSKMAGNEQGFVAGMNNAYMSLGNIFGPAAAGILFDIDINFPYVFGACILAFSLVLSVTVGRKVNGYPDEKLVVSK